jgi:hypothetical protein
MVPVRPRLWQDQAIGARLTRGRCNDGTHRQAIREEAVIVGDAPPISVPAPINGQSILGLPLLNNYFTIFDRSVDQGLGVIGFAPIKK